MATKLNLHAREEYERLAYAFSHQPVPRTVDELKTATKAAFVSRMLRLAFANGAHGPVTLSKTPLYYSRMADRFAREREWTVYVRHLAPPPLLHKQPKVVKAVSYQEALLKRMKKR